MNNRQKYLNTYSGKELIAKYGVGIQGTWHVKGEDPNCDMGGYHSQPSLGYYEGTLDEVINIAVDLSGFWQWGAGGSISLVNVQKLSSKEFRRQQEVRIRIEKTEKQLAALKDELNGV